VCGRVGPLDAEQAERLLSDLPVYVTLLSDVTEETESIDGYYVLIPALPSIADGLKKLDELKAAGIDDVWLFRGGEFRRAISLGMFSREAGAQRRVAEVTRKGFSAKVHPRASRVERRWLTLKNVDGGDLALSLPLPEGVRVVPQDCP
jgi:hypothetical protein